MNWLMNNLATIIIGAALLALVLGVIVYMRKKKKENPHGGNCGCGCASCPMSEGCQDKK